MITELSLYERTKDRRLRLQDERRRREAKAARKAELEVLYERERLERERKDEARELLKMEREDYRSVLAWRYAKELQLIESSKRNARRKAEELQKARREEAIKRVEDTMARERAQRIEERRRKAEEVKRNITRLFRALLLQ